MLSFHPYLLKIQGRTPVKQTKNETLRKTSLYGISHAKTTIIQTMVNGENVAGHD